MKDWQSYGVHKPQPNKKRGTGLKHIARTPMKTAVTTSGGGTDHGTGTMFPGHGAKGKHRKRRLSGFSMPKKDKNGYY